VEIEKRSVVEGGDFFFGPVCAWEPRINGGLEEVLASSDVVGDCSRRDGDVFYGAECAGGVAGS
jgi:hypothetical protein